MKAWLCACGARNLHSADRCEACSDIRPRAALNAGPAPHRCQPNLDTGRCACGQRFSTRAEAAAAQAVIRGVLTGALSAEDGEREIARIFGEEER